MEQFTLCANKQLDQSTEIKFQNNMNTMLAEFLQQQGTHHITAFPLPYGPAEKTEALRPYAGSALQHIIII